MPLVFAAMRTARAATAFDGFGEVPALGSRCGPVAGLVKVFIGLDDPDFAIGGLLSMARAAVEGFQRIKKSGRDPRWFGGKERDGILREFAGKKLKPVSTFFGVGREGETPALAAREELSRPVALRRVLESRGPPPCLRTHMRTGASSRERAGLSLR